jgi:hypothetical protein
LDLAGPIFKDRPAPTRLRERPVSGRFSDVLDEEHLVGAPALGLPA